MKRATEQAVRAEFQKRVARELQQFRLIESHELPAECDLFAAPLGGDLTLFVVFQVSSREESFTIELGWSTSGSYPLVGAFATGHVQCPEVSERTEARFRLPSLWTEGDVWWSLSGSRVWATLTGSDHAQRALDDAWRRLLREGIQCLRVVARKHGLSLQ